MIKRTKKSLDLSVFPPSGHLLAIQVSDDASLIDKLTPEYDDGVVWLTIPAAGCAVGPMKLQEYVAHTKAVSVHPELKALDALRGDPSRLPPTGI
jgi:hypothetical protein